MKEQLIAFLKDEDGATAIEYGLIAGLIAVAIIVALQALGTDLNELFDKVGSKLDDATAAAEKS